MHDSFCTHGYESWDNLFKDGQDFIGRESLLFLDELWEISSFTILHDDAEFFFLSFEVVFVDSDEMWVQKFPHDIDFLFCLFNLEGIDFDFFVGKFLSLLIFH